MAESNLDFDKHEIICPHCQKETVHFWPGRVILFGKAKCMYCEEEFIIVQNEPSL